MSTFPYARGLVLNSISSPHPASRFSAAALYRLAVVTVLGFASGLPLALTGQAMQAWLSLSGVDIATIGFLSLVGLPYTFKFLWAPLMDRFELPWLGRRRGWLVLTQLLLAATLAWMAATSPTGATRAFALIAVLVAFISASQDIVIDAYRTNLLPAHERGLGSSSLVLGYRLAMILSGGVAFIWVDPSQGGGWTWPEVYRFMAWLMVGAAVFSAIALPRLPAMEQPASVASRDVVGFLAVLVAVAVGVALSNRYGRPIADVLLGPALASTRLSTALQGKWLDLCALLLGIAFTLPLTAWAARAARFETLLGGLASYFAQPGAGAFLADRRVRPTAGSCAGCTDPGKRARRMAGATALNGLIGRLASTFAILSLVSIGGANATLPEIHRQVVSVLGWMDDSTFANLFAISQVAPGPNILVVSLVGWHMAGFAGLAVATAAILLPSSTLAFAAGRALARWDETAAVKTLKAGLVPIAVGLILASGLVTARSSDHGWLAWLITVAATLAFIYTKRNPLWVLAGGTLVSVLGIALG